MSQLEDNSVISFVTDTRWQAKVTFRGELTDDVEYFPILGWAVVILDGEETDAGRVATQQLEPVLLVPDGVFTQSQLREWIWDAGGWLLKVVPA